MKEINVGRRYLSFCHTYDNIMYMKIKAI